MSLDELEEAGLLLPRDDWGKGDPHSKVNKWALAAAWTLAGVSAVLMYAGNGLLATWIGLIGMLVFIGWFTYLSVHAINARHAAQLETFGPDRLAGPASAVDAADTAETD
jgi:hypothetical protein